MSKSKGKVVRDETWDRFRDWLRAVRFPRCKLTLGDFEETGRGIMATKNIEKGETIIEVPKKLLITIDRVDEDLGGALGRYPRGLTEHQALSYWLGWQRNNPDSAERPYLDMLPDNFDTCAAMLPKDLQVHLPVELQAMVSKQLEQLQNDYAMVSDFCNEMSAVKELAYDDFRWAWFAVNTRCVSLGRKKTATSSSSRLNQPTMAVAPMFDFLNHSDDAEIDAWYDESTQSFKIRTLVPFNAGEQVFIHYGPHDDLFLLGEYGFILSSQNNSHNHISLDDEFGRILLRGETMDSKTKCLKFLEENGFYGDYSLGKNDLNFRLVNAVNLRVLASRSRHFEHVASTWLRSLYNGPPWETILDTNPDTSSKSAKSNSNERDTWILTFQALRDMVLKVMSRYQHTVQELDGMHEYASVRDLRWRMVRQICVDAIEIAESLVATLDRSLEKEGIMV